MLKQEMENKQMPKANITNKSGVTLHGVKPGAGTVIEVDKNGVPKDREWRRRVKDAAIDGCVEITPIKKTKTKKEEA